MSQQNIPPTTQKHKLTREQRREAMAQRIIEESRTMTPEQHRARLERNVELLRGPRPIKFTANGITTLLEDE